MIIYVVRVFHTTPREGTRTIERYSRNWKTRDQVAAQWHVSFPDTPEPVKYEFETED